MHRRSLGVAAAIALGVLPGCGHLSGIGHGRPQPPCQTETTLAAPTTEPGVVAHGTVLLTPASNGTTVRVHVGAIIQVDLAGEPCNPQALIGDESDGTILDETSSSVTPAAGAHATFVAVKPGHDGIAQSNNCSAGTCAIAFQVGVEVDP